MECVVLGVKPWWTFLLDFSVFWVELRSKYTRTPSSEF